MTTSVQIQLRRDTATNIAANTGAQGEPWYDITNNRLVTNDGTSAGGYPHALTANLPFGGHSNLIAGNVAGPQSFTAPTSANSQVKAVANYVSVFNATLGVSKLLSGVSVMADLTVSGAGGLDTGAVAASTWYSFWIIWGTSGTSALWSTASSSPTLPSGYTYKFFVGWWVTDASSHLLRILCQGARQQYVVGTNPATLPVLASGIAGTYSDTSPTLSAVAVASLVPPTAGRILLAGIQQWKGSGSTSLILVAPSVNWGGTNNGPYGSNGNIWPCVLRAGASVAFPSLTDLMLESGAIGWTSSAAGGAIGIAAWENNR